MELDEENVMEWEWTERETVKESLEETGKELHRYCEGIYEKSGNRLGRNRESTEKGIRRNLDEWNCEVNGKK